MAAQSDQGIHRRPPDFDFGIVGRDLDTNRDFRSFIRCLAPHGFMVLIVQLGSEPIEALSQISIGTVVDDNRFDWHGRFQIEFPPRASFSFLGMRLAIVTPAPAAIAIDGPLGARAMRGARLGRGSLGSDIFPPAIHFNFRERQCFAAAQANAHITCAGCLTWGRFRARLVENFRDPWELGGLNRRIPDAWNRSQQIDASLG